MTAMIRGLGLGGVTTVCGIKVIALEVEISTTIRAMVVEGTWNPKSMEYMTVALSNVNGMLIGFLLTAIGFYWLLDGINEFIPAMVTYYKRRKKGTL